MLAMHTFPTVSAGGPVSMQGFLAVFVWLLSPEDQQPRVVRGGQWSLVDRPGSRMTWHSFRHPWGHERVDELSLVV